MDSGGHTIPKDFFTIKEIESVVKTLSTKKTLSPNTLVGKIYPVFKIFTALYNTFQIIAIKELLNSFYEANIALIPKSHKNSKRKRKEIISQFLS